MMSRLPLKSRDFVVEQVPDAFDRLDRDGQGALFDIHRVLMNVPNVFKSYMDFAMELRHGTDLPAKLRELAILTVATATGARYELDHHWVLALRAGVTRAQLDNLGSYRVSAHFSAEERAVMQFAEESTRNVVVSDEAFAEAHGHLGDRQLAELLYQIGFYNMIARFEAAAQLETESWFDREKGILQGDMNR